MFDARKLVTLVMLAIFTGAVLIALTLPSQAAFMPFLVGIPGILLCLAQLFIDFTSPPAPRKDKAKASADDAQSEAQMFLWLALFTGVLIGFGFLCGGPILVLLFVRFSSRDSWLNAAFAGSGTWCVLYGVFHVLLGLRLFPGLILKALF